MVLLRGVSSKNKGAELMLAAVAEHLRSIGSPLVLHPHVGSYSIRSSYGAYQLFEVSKIGRLGPILQSLFRRNYRQLYGLVQLQECTALLDASGFFLGDQWRHPGQQLLEVFRAFKIAGKPIVMLPQSFGPFEQNSTARDQARELLELADLVYAREPQSLDFVKRLLPGHNGIRLSPDFTAVVPPSQWSTDRRDVGLIVPNCQMIKQGGVPRPKYNDFLCTAGQALRDSGLQPAILCHESGVDPAIADSVVAAAPWIQRIEVGDPRDLKAVVGGAVVTVGARYHGLVSALSQGVPSVMTGWSHKYHALAEEYGCADCLVDPRTVESHELTELIAKLVDQREERRVNLLGKAGDIRARIMKMWREIDELLACRGVIDLAWRSQ